VRRSLFQTCLQRTTLGLWLGLAGCLSWDADFDQDGHLPPAFGGGVLARRAVMETLVLHPDPRLKNLPLKGLKDKDLAVRHNAIRALGNMSAAAPVQELVAELNQPVRKQAKPAQAQDEPAPQTEAESIRIQEKADVIRALGAIGQPAAEALRRYLKRGAEAEMLEVTALLAFASSARSSTSVAALRRVSSLVAWPMSRNSRRAA